NLTDTECHCTNPQTSRGRYCSGQDASRRKRKSQRQSHECWQGRTERKELIMFPHSTARFEMFDAAKNKLRVKVSYLMIALIVAECICMVIEDKK
ncbi:hypothetical protein U0070_007054, partial [Myodes glareolus]